MIVSHFGIDDLVGMLLFGGTLLTLLVVFVYALVGLVAHVAGREFARGRAEWEHRK